jgi:hypothetical protein
MATESNGASATAPNTPDGSPEQVRMIIVGAGFGKRFSIELICL